MRLTRIVFAVALLVAASPPASTLADPSLSRVVAAHTLKVGVAINAPWVIRKPDGSLEGYDVDLANALAGDLGVKAAFVEMPFQDLVTKLADGEVDLVAAGLAITPARAMRVVFSNSTGAAPIRTVAAIAGLGADPVQTLATPGFRIGVMAQSTDEAAARAAYPAARITPYPSQGAALAALIGGSEQAMVASAPVPTMATRLYDADLRLVGLPLTHTAEAFALRPDDARLLAFVNNWIVARGADGYLDNVRNHWFYNFEWLRDLGPRDEPAAR